MKYDGDYYETPRTQRRNLREKQKYSQDVKTKYVRELQERNKKLRYEIVKIKEVLEEQKEKNSGKKQYKLIPHETGADVLKKELDNAYKQIKNYEKQINNLESRQAGGMMSDKMAKLQIILKEKVSHREKLKNQLSALSKNSIDNSKKLKNNIGKESLENSMLKYNEDIKTLREKVREAENLQKKKSENAKKQFDYIKKLQRELIQNGVAIDEIQELKRNNIYNHIYDRLKNGEAEKEVGRSRAREPVEEGEEQVTVERLNEIKNQIKLFQKLQKDYDKRLQLLEKQKKREETNMVPLKEKIQERDEEIKKLQEEISELKSKARRNQKPSFNTKQSKQKGKMSPTKPRNSISLGRNNNVKYDEKGQYTKGDKFYDRNIIGKNDSRIIGVKVWTDKTTLSIHGIQCIYQINESGIKSGKECVSKESKKYCIENIMDLEEGDYIKSISGHLGNKNTVQYLVFMSKTSKIGRFGMAKENQRPFTYEVDEDQIPTAMYGSLLAIREQSKDGSALESLGFEICRDSALNKDDKYI